MSKQDAITAIKHSIETRGWDWDDEMDGAADKAYDAGYRAAREDAAKVAENEIPNHGHPLRLKPLTRAVAAEIRKLEP